MKILILGSNDIAYNLAQELSKIDYAVTVVDNKVDQIKQIDRELDVKGIIGYPTYPSVLDNADCETTDILIAVLDNDEANMVACQIAHSLFNVPLKIARIKNHHYLNQGKLYGDEDLPIDVFISPEILLTRQITSLINFPGAEEIRFFGSAYIVLIRIQASSPWITQKIKTVENDNECLITFIQRDGKWLIPDIKFSLKENDQLLFASKRGNVSKILASAGIENPEINNIMVGGLGHNGTNLIRNIQSNYNIKAIEKNSQQCNRAATEFENITVLHGKISDRQLMVDEGVAQSDFFCALTDDESENILSSLMAKKMGCKKVVTLLTNTIYYECINELVDYVIISKLALINAILTEIYKGESIHEVKSISCGEITLIKMGITEHFNHLNFPATAIPYPKNATFVGILRDNEFFSDRDTLIKKGDFVLLASTEISDIPKMDELFSSF
ncbi:MAG: Trk system potassium transporter TrkA [Legionellales bacterium]|nr:Trk system potassium transporter TrkA [Legionellales bacterium]OUX64943.1 MAG: Trk system potassium transport protein TrkA [Gammaproteobacteria bacterium TMED281]